MDIYPLTSNFVSIQMKWVVLFLLMFLSSQPVLAQKRNIEIVGEIVDAETREPIPYVHILNTKDQKGTVSNTQGRFWVTIEEGDSLLLSAIGFDKYVFALKDNIETGQLLLTIELNKSTMELQPVKVFAFKNEEGLKQALKGAKIPLEEPDSKIELPGFYYGPKKKPKDLQFESNKITLTGPFSLIERKWSKRAKERMRLKNYESQYQYHKLIKTKFNEDVIMELTGLPKDEVEKFMDFCKLSDAFLGPASEYEIAVAVKKCLTDFNEVVIGDSIKDDK